MGTEKTDLNKRVWHERYMPCDKILFDMKNHFFSSFQKVTVRVIFYKSLKAMIWIGNGTKDNQQPQKKALKVKNKIASLQMFDCLLSPAEYDHKVLQYTLNIDIYIYKNYIFFEPTYFTSLHILPVQKIPLRTWISASNCYVIPYRYLPV